MFKDTKAVPGFSVDDMHKAKAFYGQTLGLRVSEAYGTHQGRGQGSGWGTDPGSLLELHIAGGTRIVLYLKSDHTPASFTVLTFPVEDIEKAVDALSERGVKFERYDGLPADEKGIHRNDDPPVDPVAWFKDPAGNILSVSEER